MRAVAVRTAVGADLDVIREVFRVASLSNASDRAALLADPEVLIWPGTAITEEWTRVAVADDGAIVGFATAVPVDGALELEDLFVEPGRMRQGVARRLIADVLTSAAGSGIRTVRVTANPHDGLLHGRRLRPGRNGADPLRAGPAATARRRRHPPVSWTRTPADERIKGPG